MSLYRGFSNRSIDDIRSPEVEIARPFEERLDIP